MLDPAQRHLQVVQDFLTDHDFTAVQQLSKYLDLHTLDENEEPTQESAQDGIDTVPWKKAKMDLLTKHSCKHLGPTIEIQQYRCLSLSGESDNLLEWWGLQQGTQ